MPLVTEHNFNGVQTFDSRYIDKSRLETLLKALYSHSPYSVKRQLNEWRVEAPQPLDPVCIVIVIDVTILPLLLCRLLPFIQRYPNLNRAKLTHCEDDKSCARSR